MESFARLLRERPHRRGEIILGPRSPGDRVYLVKSGTVRVYRLGPDGQEVTTALLRSGQFFWAPALVGGEEPPDLAEALEDVMIGSAMADEFFLFVSRHMLLAQRIIVALARQHLHLEQHLERLILHNISGRLVQLLLELAEANGTCRPLRLSHADLAKLLCTTRETVTRTLHEFAERGLLSIGYRRLTILDADSLRSTAGLVGANGDPRA